MNSSSVNSTWSYFHPNISGEEAETILKSVGKYGSFLLRLCNQVNGYDHYTLSVMSNMCFTHLKIQCSNGYYSIRGEGEFESPYDVIQNCIENPDILKGKDGSIIELKHPVVNAKKPTRWYHGNVPHKDAEKILKENGKDGSFLVRASYRHPGDYVLCVRLKDESVCVKIYTHGDKFDVGAGKQFNSIDDLILHYKKYPLKTNKGVDIHLDQGIDTNSGVDDCYITAVNILLPIKWYRSENNPVTLATLCTNGCPPGQGKAMGTIQVFDQNGDMTINLHGNKNIYSQFTVYCAVHYKSIICLESCAYSGKYIYWNQTSLKVQISSCANDGNMPPSDVRNICWRQLPYVCDQNQVNYTGEIRDAHSIHKLSSCKDEHTQYYLTFEATDQEPDNFSAKLTPEWDFSSNVLFVYL